MEEKPVRGGGEVYTFLVLPNLEDLCSGTPSLVHRCRFYSLRRLCALGDGAPLFGASASRSPRHGSCPLLAALALFAGSLSFPTGDWSFLSCFNCGWSSLALAVAPLAVFLVAKVGVQLGWQVLRTILSPPLVLSLPERKIYVSMYSCTCLSVFVSSFLVLKMGIQLVTVPSMS